ncbi:hypothetical protein Moror_14373 [Moniliophthora roreri MCA 2997]|uniref:Uncharacterized protein n=1 Tax=Moniliophthora roreri (strain MCA 2997) TaxID=1381753 RepID=V2WLS1_MONRO|nr:hypothetical protein Moror_14373 [Moniliophthora roreri MCA 2997]
MSAGGRWDMINDHCNYSNWHKTVQLDNSLLKKLVKAITEAKAQITEWEWDHTKPCPYDLPASMVTMAKVKRQLAEEDLKKEKECANPTSSTMMLSGMLIEGLEIEVIQRGLSTDVKMSKVTIFQETSIQKCCTTLLHRIHNFHETQVIHLPALCEHLEAVD